jgi:hypothetical protein
LKVAVQGPILWTIPYIHSPERPEEETAVKRQILEKYVGMFTGT